MNWTKLVKANDNELVDNIEVVYLDEDLTKAQLEVSVRDFENGQIKSSRSWLINSDKIKQAEQLVANFQKKWSTYLFDSAGSRYLTDRVWNDITAIRKQVCVDNKKSSQQIKAFDLHSIIKKIRDTLGDIADSSTASDAEWFDQGEYAYLYIPLNQIDFRKNVTTGEINEEALEKIEEMNGQKVEVIKINKTSKGFETGGIITGKPESVDVRLENGDILKDVPTTWLKHQPFGEDDEDRKVESKLDNLYDLSIELGEEVMERISELMDSGFEGEEIVDMVSNEYDCEPAQIQAVIDEVEYESNILKEEYFDKEVDAAVEEATRILKGE